MKVYQAINAVQAALAVEGIGKDRKNEMQGYKFRGIDDVYNALAPLLAKNGLCILPRCTERICVERINAKGTALFYVTVRADFDFVSSEDGSKHTITTYGEAMDSGDKATNKAMSAAYKYAAMQAFAIPTEGDNDADTQTHEVNSAAMEKVLATASVQELTALFKAMPERERAPLVPTFTAHRKTLELKKEFAPTDDAAMQKILATASVQDDDDGNAAVKAKQATSLVPVLEASIEQVKQRKAGVMNAVLADIHLDAATEMALHKLAPKVTADAAGFDLVEDQGLNSDEKTFLWSLLDSKVRSALKRERDTRALMHSTKETA